MSKYVQLSLFPSEAPAAIPEEQLVKDADTILQKQLVQASDGIVPVLNEQLIEMLTPGKELEFVKAAEATMKLYWRSASKDKKTPKRAFFNLFLQLGSQQNVSRARYLMHYNVKTKALGDFYDAGDEAMCILPRYANALLPSMPVKDVYAQNLPTLLETNQSQVNFDLEALQARFDELFARRRTTAEVIYLRILLDAEDVAAMYTALK
ncbi:MAG: hypothetical protein V7L20_15505 [Nostoc sp.]|uniref:hypothetical protein n=1 Tax=Nostoc sp. TaxID=1180 RepID=UPI002FF4FD62